MLAVGVGNALSSSSSSSGYARSPVPRWSATPVSAPSTASTKSTSPWSPTSRTWPRFCVRWCWRAAVHPRGGPSRRWRRHRGSAAYTPAQQGWDMTVTPTATLGLHLETPPEGEPSRGHRWQRVRPVPVGESMHPPEGAALGVSAGPRDPTTSRQTGRNNDWTCAFKDEAGQVDGRSPESSISATRTTPPDPPDPGNWHLQGLQLLLRPGYRLHQGEHTHVAPWRPCTCW